MKWHRMPPKPNGRIEEVCGRATVVQPVRGPMDGFEGLVVVTVLATKTSFRTHLVQIVTANDFLLEDDSGRSLVVRARDVWAHWGWTTYELGLPSWRFMDPLPCLLPESMQEKIAGTPLQPPAALRYRDFVFPSGSRFEIRGLVREEPAPFGLPGSGFRDQAVVPTLTGGGGRLELRYLFPDLHATKKRPKP